MGKKADKMAESDEKYQEVQKLAKAGTPLIQAMKEAGILHGAYYSAKKRAGHLPKKKERGVSVTLELYEKAKALVAKGSSVNQACKQVGLAHSVYAYHRTRENKKTALTVVKPRVERASRHEVIPLLHDFTPSQESVEPLTITITGSPRLVAQFFKEAH